MPDKLKYRKEYTVSVEFSKVMYGEKCWGHFEGPGFKSISGAKAFAKKIQADTDYIYKSLPVIYRQVFDPKKLGDPNFHDNSRVFFFCSLNKFGKWTMKQTPCAGK